MLIVENDPAIARDIKAQLAGTGCTVDWARDGVEALQHLGADAPAALVRAGPRWSALVRAGA